MFKSYLKTAWRNLSKNKLYALTNIAGLSVGMAVAILIGLWIWDELSYNKYHQHYDRIAQVMEQNTINGEIHTGVATAIPVAFELKKDFGGDFKHIVLSSWKGPHALVFGEKQVYFNGSFMSPEAPNMLTLKMLKGSSEGLKDPSSILIAESVANAMFGNNEPLGQMIKVDNKSSLIVSGVYEDLPKNTTFHDLAFIAPWDNYVAIHDWVRHSLNAWRENSFQIYVELADNADMQKVSSSIRDIKLKFINSEGAKSKPQIILQPMRKWHLYNEFKNGINTGGAIEYVWMFGIIGIFVLLLACINFMNLSTARSEKRAKEVGIRKTIGSLRSQLMKQFFFESILLAIMAFAVGLFLVELVLPFFNTLSAKNMFVPWANAFFWILSIVFTLFTGVIAGLYPALYLSSFNPIKVLKGTFKAGRSAAMPRRILVTAQFVVSVILIIGTIVVFKQIQFAKDRPVGYSRNGLLTFSTSTHDMEQHFDAFATDLSAAGIVASIAETTSPLTQNYHFTQDLSWNGKDPNIMYDFAKVKVTSGYGNTIRWQMIAGRDFSPQFPTDSSAIILNEAAVKYMGLKHPLGENLRFGAKNYTVIGVAKDMVIESPYTPAKQTFFYLGADDFDEIVIRINPSMSAHEALNQINTIYKKYCPSLPMDYSFVDTEYAAKFIDEERIGKLAGVFALLAIFISCVGLFGMASFMAEQRTKELGVRKVLGASITNLWGLLSKEFIVLVFIALLIATPVAYYFTHNWLQHYAYRTEVSWWVFAVTGLGALFITLLTVSFQSIKAALANPVKSLRTE